MRPEAVGRVFRVIISATDPQQPFDCFENPSIVCTLCEGKLIRIVTNLECETVRQCLENLVSRGDSAGVIPSDLYGEIRGLRFNVASRTRWFVPFFRIAVFQGRIRTLEGGTAIEGKLVTSWFVYAFSALLAMSLVYSLIRFAVLADYSNLLWSLAMIAGVFLLGRFYVSTSRRSIVDEICRVTRGRVG